MREKVSMGPEATARDAAMKIISSGLAAIPMVSGEQELIGVVTENSVLAAIRDGLDLAVIPAVQISVPAPTLVDVNTPTDELVRLLRESCCSLAVVTRDGKYAGVVSRSMLMDIFTSPHYARFAQKERKGRFACL